MADDPNRWPDLDSWPTVIGAPTPDTGSRGGDGGKTSRIKNRRVGVPRALTLRALTNDPS